MQFTHLKLENWRNFGTVAVALQTRAFLVGPNASGKSNFLDAFRFLRDLVIPGGGFEKAVADRGGVSRLRNVSARYPSTDIVIEVAMDDSETGAWRYRLAFTQDNLRRPLLKEEAVVHNDESLLHRPNEADDADVERLHQTYLEQTFANRPFRAVAEFFADIHYYHLVPQLVRDTDRYVGTRGDPYGSDFLERLAETNKRTREARLRRIQRALQIAVPQLSELKLDQDSRGVPHLYGNYEHWRPQGAWQSEADFSDGTLRLLGLLWSILEGSGPLLLEEPELSLHPAIVQYIPQMIHQVQKKRKRRQVFLSTHSSDLLRDEGIAADEILLFLPAREVTDVQVGADIAEVRQLLESGLTAADVVPTYTRPPNAEQLALFES